MQTVSECELSGDSSLDFGALDYVTSLNKAASNAFIMQIFWRFEESKTLEIYTCTDQRMAPGKAFRSVTRPLRVA